VPPPMIRRGEKEREERKGEFVVSSLS